MAHLGQIARQVWYCIFEISVTDLCASSPCVSGQGFFCLPRINSYLCFCYGGFTGVNCETGTFFNGSSLSAIPSNCTSNFCQNGGLCVDFQGSIACLCPPTFVGDQCQCDPFLNPQCNSDNNACLSSPCANNGTCIPAGTDYYCNCTNMKSSRNCEWYPWGMKLGVKVVVR